MTLRKRLNFKQSAKGIISFDGTVEIVSEDTAISNKELADESLKILQEAEKTFKDAKYEVVKP